MTLAEDIKTYYSKLFIQFEIVKANKGREMALLPNKHPMEGMKAGIAVRNIKAYSLGYLNSNLEAFDFYKKNYNIYVSVAILKNFPTFSYAVTQRQSQQKEFLQEFYKNPKNFIDGYDIFIDIDSDNFKEGYHQTQKTINFFKEYDLPVMVNPSGGKDGGFHIKVDFKHFKGLIPPTKMPKLGREIATDLMEDGVSDLDWKLFDIRRVTKCPYTLVYNGTNLNVVLPLTQEQFKDLTPETYKLKNVMKEVALKSRGLCEWHFDTPRVKEFLEAYRFKERMKK